MPPQQRDIPLGGGDGDTGDRCVSRTATARSHQHDSDDENDNHPRTMNQRPLLQPLLSSSILHPYDNNKKKNRNSELLAAYYNNFSDNHNHHHDDDPHGHRPQHIAADFPQCRSWLAHFLNLTKQIVGAGALGLPGALAALHQENQNPNNNNNNNNDSNTVSALIPLALLILGIGTVSAYGFCLIGRLCAVTQATSYRQAWARTVGDGQKSWMPAWACLLVAVSSVTTYNMVLAETLPDLVKPLLSIEIPKSTALLAVTTFCLLPLCLLKELTSLAPYSCIGLLAMVYLAMIMTERYCSGYYAENGRLWQELSDKQKPRFESTGTDKDHDDNFLNPTNILWSFVEHPQTYVTIISMLSTSFMAHYNAPKYYWELPPASSNNGNTPPTSPIHRFDSIVASAFFGSMLLLSTIAFMGFATFGNNSQALILNNYASSDTLIAWSKVGVVLSIISSYPLSFVGIKDGLFDLFQVTPRKRQEVGEIVTVALLIVLSAAALLIEDIRVMMAFSGATWGNCVIYIFPSWMIIRGVRKYPELKPHVVPAALTALLGVCLGTVGALQALRNLVAFLRTFSFGMFLD